MDSKQSHMRKLFMFTCIVGQLLIDKSAFAAVAEVYRTGTFGPNSAFFEIRNPNSEDTSLWIAMPGKQKNLIADNISYYQIEVPAGEEIDQRLLEIDSRDLINFQKPFIFLRTATDKLVNSASKNVATAKKSKNSHIWLLDYSNLAALQLKPLTDSQGEQLLETEGPRLKFDGLTLSPDGKKLVVAKEIVTGYQCASAYEYNVVDLSKPAGPMLQDISGASTGASFSAFPEMTKIHWLEDSQSFVFVATPGEILQLDEECRGPDWELHGGLYLAQNLSDNIWNSRNLLDSNPLFGVEDGNAKSFQISPNGKWIGVKRIAGPNHAEPFPGQKSPLSFLSLVSLDSLKVEDQKNC